MNEERYRYLLKEGQDLKDYFDKLCGCDVYEILGIKKTDSPM